MCDQLRADYLGCNGHPHIETKNIDWLASKSVNFSRAYVQAPVCGPSRMSIYTGRYVSTHGATWNKSPIRIDEITMGQALRDQGLRSALVGKSHIVVDPEVQSRLVLDKHCNEMTVISEGGFEPVERDDGVHRDTNVSPNLAYNQFLRSKGYTGRNPWHSYANSAEGPDGEILTGWKFRNSNRPARVSEEHSETAYMTDRALEFIENQGDEPWFLHLSYIKPHWPYIAPAPYHSRYTSEQVNATIKNSRERLEPHPIARVLMEISDSQAFANEETRAVVIPTYMGLIHQIDDHLGRIFDLLKRIGRMDDTMIVFTSDHGDHLGDHWLADKGMFYEQATRVPMIIYDPTDAADEVRGTVCNSLVEGIDLLPTFLEATGASIPEHRLEGESLMPILIGKSKKTNRKAVFSEMDYAFIETREALKMPLDKSMGRMVRTEDWKYVHFDSLPPQLFDLNSDPNELDDLGCNPKFADIRATMKELLLDWSLSRKTRITVDHERASTWLSAGKKIGISKSEW